MYGDLGGGVCLGTNRAVPVVMGDLGTVGQLRHHLRQSQLLDSQQVNRLTKEIQREVICSGIRIAKRHFVLNESPSLWLRSRDQRTLEHTLVESSPNKISIHLHHLCRSTTYLIL